MEFTALLIPLSQDLWWYFQLRSYHCWDRQEKPQICAAECSHSCKLSKVHRAKIPWVNTSDAAGAIHNARGNLMPNAVQTAAARENIKRCTLGWTTLVSASTLKDKKIRFLLSYIKKEIWSILSCTGPTRDAVGIQGRCQSTIKAGSILTKGPDVYGSLSLKKSPREILFLANCVNMH